MSSPFISISSEYSVAHDALSGACNESAKSQPLTGLRLAVKDLFHMAGLPTAAGNPDWLATHPLPEKTNRTVEILLDAGAQFVGKTITDELAYSLHGQNKHYPTLINPAAREHIPGGSSSGSAVAVTENLADIGLGTDTGGSIRVPASYQGLWGLRTTHGAISCDNMVPLAPAFDTVGWMTRDLDTLEAVAQVCLNQEQQNPNATEVKFGIADGLFKQVAHKHLCRDWLDQLPKRTTLSHITLSALSSSALDLEALATANTFRILQGAEIWQQHGNWIDAHSPDIANDIMLRLNWCKTITSSDIQSAKAQQQVIINHLNSLFAEIDVLVIPTTPGVAPRCDADDETLAKDRNTLLGFTALAGLAGLPQLHLPLFTLHNAPCGLSLVGKKGSDLALISIAKHLAKT